MQKPTKFIARTLSVRISLMVVSAVALLLTAAILAMLHFSRVTMREEALQKAEQTLEGTILQIDNILLSVEQTAGNIYCDLLNHLDQPEMMVVYTHKLVETNPHIIGAAIAFEPYYYKERGQYFMTYVHKNSAGGTSTSDSPVIQASTFGNKPYPEQVWYQTPIKNSRPYWLNPVDDIEEGGEAILSFCLPIYSVEGKPVGVLGADVSLALLSKIVLAAKPSANSYATLLGSDGTYIVHPDSNKLMHETIVTLIQRGADHTAQEAAEAMLAGETGYKQFRLYGVDNYVFYKPFKRSAVPGRSTEDLGWSIGIIYPEDDIFGDFKHLLFIVVIIASLGILLLFVLCQLITHRQLLPLGLLTKSTQRIANGLYNDPIPDSKQEDEVGRLQDHFQQMQQALATNMGKLEQLTETLRERNEVLGDAYEQAKEADRIKTAVLHNMTNQMTTPVSNICEDVKVVCEEYERLDEKEADRLVYSIQQQGKTVTELLNHLLKASQEEIRN